jgi:nicotinamidase/pyrazinamidase
MRKALFVFVDCQNDFIRKDGLLSVQNAESIIPNLIKIKNFAVKNNIQILFTADNHKINSEEISKTPDFINTFPEHCLNETDGANVISEIYNENDDVKIMDWRNPIFYQKLKHFSNEKQILLLKDEFDMFNGNQDADQLIKLMSPTEVYICGVATNVCVDFAVKGFVKRKAKVFVFTDAIKELPNKDMNEIINNWVQSGVQLITTDMLK